MKGFVDDIGRLTKGNADFRRVLYTGHHLQLVLMTLPPGGEIGSEVHKDRDQFFRVEAGDGEMAERIARHRGRRGSDWETVEEPLEVVEALGRVDGRYSVVLPSKCSGSASASAFVRRTTPSR